MTVVASSSGSTQRRRHFIRWLWIGTLLINLCVIGLVGHVVDRQRDSEISQARVLTENYSRILEENLLGFISKVDLSLRTVSDEVARQAAAGGIDEASLNELIARQDAHVAETVGLRVTDAEGVIRYAVTDVKVNNASIADRPHFIHLRDHPGAGLAFSKPLSGRVSGKWMIAIARRISLAGGEFGGIALAAVPVQHFIDMFANIDLGEHGNVGLWDEDTLIGRFSREDRQGATVGSTTPSDNLRALLRSGQVAAFYHARSGVDGTVRTYHFRQVGNHPLYLVVGIAEQDYLTKWRNDSLGIAGLAALFVLATLLSAWQIGRNWRRLEADREERHQQAAEYTARLEASGRAAEAAWQEREQILASAAEGICGVDLAGRVIFANPAARRMYGWAEGEGIGLDLHAATHHHGADGVPWASGDCPVSQTLRDGQRRHVSDSLYWRQDGTSFPVEYTVSAIERDGRITGAVNVFRDISERKQIEGELEQHRLHLEDLVERRTAELMETEAQASLILESSADGLYGIDASGVITFVNPAACAMLGYSAEYLVGQLAHPLFHHSRPDGSPYPAGECPSYGALRLGDKVRVADEVYWHADGHAIPVMYATHPMIRNGEIVGAVTSFVDVSLQRAAAEAREQALLAAENLARVRREFLANMSHEIRTPLNGVLGFAEIGYRNCQDSDKARAAFLKIQNSGKRLLGVINDILDFSRIEAGKLKIEQTEVAIAELVDNAVDLVRDRAEAKHLALQVELADNLPPVCISDPLRMGQILLNILSNAVKFTEAGSISLSVACRDDKLIFRVADTGIGMDAGQLAVLFNPFQQADASASRRFGGSGLGLAISRRILDLMGGDIRVDSQPGVGTVVEFDLPCVVHGVAGQADGEVVAALEPAVRRLAGLSVLVADDESINRLVLEAYLTEHGARSVMAADGREALERVVADGSAAFDVVLMDIQMPEMDGYEATRRIHAIAPDLPVIAQTAHAFSEEREKCLAAGMVGHLAKPVDIDELVAVLQPYVKSAG